MRNEVCRREYVEKLYGKEKGERYLHELEHGLSLSNAGGSGYNNYENQNQNGNGNGNEGEHSDDYATFQKDAEAMEEEKEMEIGAGMGTLRGASTDLSKNLSKVPTKKRWRDDDGNIDDDDEGENE
eukprot:305521_1